MVVLGDPEHSCVLFDDRSYRWIDVKRFPWDGIGEDQEVLTALIESPHYRDSYIAADQHGALTVHGPYRVADISSGDFERVTSEAAEAVVGEFSNLYDSPPETVVHAQIESIVLRRLRAAACYRLPRLAQAEHECAFVLLEFRELVLLSRGPGEVVLVVMAID